MRNPEAFFSYNKGADSGRRHFLKTATAGTVASILGINCTDVEDTDNTENYSLAEDDVQEIALAWGKISLNGMLQLHYVAELPNIDKKVLSLSSDELDSILKELRDESEGIVTSAYSNFADEYKSRKQHGTGFTKDGIQKLMESYVEQEVVKRLSDKIKR